MPNSHHPIQLVSRLTGLSMHVIRIWEQRYQAVEPQRTQSNRRLYSPQQIERLILLRDATHAGYNIGQVASLADETLRKLAAESPSRMGGDTHPVVETFAPGSLIDASLAAIKMFDSMALESVLKRAETELGALGLLHRLIAPLAHALGELWRAGEITSAHEHFGTAAVRVFLANAAKPFGVLAHGPVLIVATPAGQIHELGALLVAAAAANFGWRVTYLGASLPAAEIAGAVLVSKADAVALSLVYPSDDPQLGAELERLREALPPATALLVGGRAAFSYQALLERIKATRIDSLAQLGLALDELRKLPVV